MNISSELKELEHAAVAISSALRLKPDMTREEFRTYIAGNAVNQGQAYAIAVLDQVPAMNLDLWRAKIQSQSPEIIYSKTIIEQHDLLSNANSIVYPVRFHYRAGNYLLPGSLSDSQWDRAVITDRVLEKNSAQLGPIVDLTNRTSAFHFGYPFYGHDGRHIAGVILVQIDLEHFLRRSLSPNWQNRVQIEIRQHSTGSSWRLDHRGLFPLVGPELDPNALTYLSSVGIENSLWSVKIKPRAGTFGQDWNSIALAVMVSITMVLLAITAIDKSAKYSRRLESEVSDRTRELADAAAVAERANRAKSRFIGAMSHELKTPLNSIIGFSEILEEETNGSATQNHNEYAMYILNSGRRLLGAVDNIMALTRVEAGDLKPALHEVFIIRFVQSLGDQFCDICREKNVTLSINCSIEDRHLIVDPGLIKQAFNNLIDNAVKYTPIGGSVDINAEMSDDGSLQIVIEDTGPGMSEDQINNAIRPFEQLESLYSRSHEGLGLGLSLAKAFIELNRGTLTINSEPGKGTAIIIQFPSNLLTDQEEDDFL